MTTKAYDPRTIANAILDIADVLGLDITHLALQKLLYFSHGLYLLEHKNPLVSGYFEAWQNGPVHPSVYRCFKPAGKLPIKLRAKAFDILSGAETTLEILDEPRIRAHLAKVVSFYGPLSASRLRDISHAPRGPWWQTVNNARTSIALGMRITDDVTGEWFRFQNVSVVRSGEAYEVHEDAPFTPDRLGSDRAAAD